jgi:excisionase family DNA binding protein
MYRPKPLGIEPKTFSVKETERLTSLGHTTVSALIKSGVLKSTKIGRKRLVFGDSIDRLLTTGTESTAK